MEEFEKPVLRKSPSEWSKELLQGRYKTIKQIGEGGTGRVFLAEDIHMNRSVAVKIMKYTKKTDEEVEILKKLNFAAFPQIMDYWREEEFCFLVMEYIEGITLREYLKSGKTMPEYECIGFMKELSDIFCFLHDQKPAIIYRDLKPENVMIASDRRIRLVDFGASFERSYSGEDLDGYGTKGYTAPEVFKGIRAKNTADIYSMGAIMYELLTGICPGKRGGVRPLRNISRTFEKGTEKIVKKCMEEEPVMRFKNVEELKDALENYRRAGYFEKIFWTLKKICVVLAYVTAAVSAAEPFIRNGAASLSFDDIRLTSVYLGIAVLLHIAFIIKPLGKGNIKTEKQIWLTEKKYSGLLIILGVCLGAGSLSLGTEVVSVPVRDQKEAKSTEEAPGEEICDDELWVEMRDETERKILVKTGDVYEIPDKLRFEIPREFIPEKDMSIRLVASSDSGQQYISREFKVRRAEE